MLTKNSYSNLRQLHEYAAVFSSSLNISLMYNTFFMPSISQSINHSVNQSLSQSIPQLYLINQSITHSINQSFLTLSITPPHALSVQTSINQSVKQSTSRSISTCFNGASHESYANCKTNVIKLDEVIPYSSHQLQ